MEYVRVCMRTCGMHISQDGIEAVAAAMAAHPEVAEVQAYGCSALGNCAIGDGEAAVRAHGLPLVLAAMAALPEDAELQSKACWATG